jgi:hypothetical protein
MMFIPHSTKFEKLLSLILKARQRSSGLVFRFHKLNRPLAETIFAHLCFTSQPLCNGIKFSMSPQEAPRGRRVGRQPPSVLQMKVEPRPICLKFSSMTTGSTVIPAADVSSTLGPHGCVVNNTGMQHTRTEFKHNIQPDSQTEEGKVKGNPQKCTLRKLFLDKIL